MSTKSCGQELCSVNPGDERLEECPNLPMTCSACLRSWNCCSLWLLTNKHVSSSLYKGTTPAKNAIHNHAPRINHLCLVSMSLLCLSLAVGNGNKAKCTLDQKFLNVGHVYNIE